MTARASARYRLVPGTDVVPMGADGTLFRSDAVAVRIEGASSELFRDRVLPLLDGRRDLAEVGGLLPDLELDDLGQHLDALVDAGVLRRDEGPQDASAEGGRIAPFLSFLAALGLAPSDARARLAALRVVVAGLEGHGAHAAAALAACGVGELVLVDPFPCEAGNLALLPGSVGKDALGRPRQQAVKAALDGEGHDTTVELGVEVALTREAVAEMSAGADVLVGCFDKGFSAVNQWLNAASLAQGVPAVYAQLRLPTVVVGPLVIPDETACYMCWRMRNLACDDDFAGAMAYEEHLDGQRRPSLHERGAFPALAPYVGSLVAMEVVKLLLLRTAETLAGKVHTYDLLTARTEVHPVLAVPDCPACRKKAPGGYTRLSAS